MDNLDDSLTKPLNLLTNNPAKRDLMLDLISSRYQLTARQSVNKFLRIVQVLEESFATRNQINSDEYLKEKKENLKEKKESELKKRKAKIKYYLEYNSQIRYDLKKLEREFFRAFASLPREIRIETSKK